MKARMMAIVAGALAVSMLPASAETVHDVSCREAINILKQLHSPDPLRKVGTVDSDTLRVLATEGAYTAIFLNCSPTEQRMAARQPYFDKQFIVHIPATDE